jgi:hypothetical protein
MSSPSLNALQGVAGNGDLLDGQVEHLDLAAHRRCSATDASGTYLA